MNIRVLGGLAVLLSVAVAPPVLADKNIATNLEFKPAKGGD
jgi:hypothetical protein